MAIDLEWFILSRDLHVLCVPSSEAQDSLPIFDDKQTIVLQNNTVVSTYDFSVQQKHPDATNLKWGNYVVFRDKYGKTRMYTLISHDGDDLVQTWHAEDIGLDLLNETADKWDYTGESYGIDWYFNNLVLKDTGWSIGINEISNLTRGLKFDGQSDTQLKRLGDIANQFDGAEIDFEVALDGSRVTKQVVNIYKKVGNPMAQQRFIDAVNLKSLQSSGSIEDLCTAMIGYGSQPDAKEGESAEDVPPIDFADLSYDDGVQFFSPKGDKAVYDRINHLAWSRYSGFDTSNQNETKGYITGIYTYETKDANELLNRTITQLKKRNTPSETYEANLLDIDADIGDEVQIAHNNYNPPIYLSARVESVTNCYTANGQDTGILGDYQKLESKIDPRIQDMIDQLANQIKPNYTWIRYAKDDKGTGMTATPTPDTKYVAIVSNKSTGVPSDDPSDYAGRWQLIKGNDGKDGIPGATGADGKTSYTHFAYANNVSGTLDFSTDDPTGRSYMGVYSDFTKPDSNNPSDYVWSLTKGESGADGMQGAQGPKGEQGIAGKPGADGKTSYTHVAYADNASGGGFSQNPANKAYMGWYTDFTANDSTDPTKYAWSLIKGSDGSNGAPGKPGADGKTPYFHQAWADSKDGKINFSTTDPTNRGYLGTYSDFTQADSTDPSKYFWVELVGALGIGTPNLVYNAGLQGSYKNGLDGWIPNGTGAPNAWYRTTAPASMYNGVNGMGINYTYPSSSTNVWHMIDSKHHTPIDAGQVFSASAQVKIYSDSTAGTVSAVLSFFDANGTRLAGFYDMATHSTDSGLNGNVEASANQNRDKWQQAHANGIVAPANAASVAIQYYVHPKLNTSSKIHVIFSAPVVNVGTKPVQYMDNQGSGSDVTQVNEKLESVNKEIAAVPKVTTSKTAPTNPKTGDQWWVQDANNEINAFKQWNGTTWVNSTIQQSLLIIKTLDAVNINGSVINGSKFTNAFTFNNMLGATYTGVTTIADGAVKITYKIPSTNETGTTQITAEGYKQELFNSAGSRTGLSMLSPNSLQLQTNGVGGFLTPSDLVRYGPEDWYNSDASGTKFTIRLELRWGRVWLSGVLLLPVAKFGTGGNGYRTIFNIKNTNLRPASTRWVKCSSFGDVPHLGLLEFRPNGDVVAIGVPSEGRYSFEGESYTIESL